MSGTPPVSELVTAAEHLIGAKYYAIAAYTMFVYDIVLTFPVEVQKIWCRKFTGLTVLWFLNRWVYLAGVTIVYVAYLDQGWGPVACNGYVKFPGYWLAFLRAVVGAIFTIRLYCIFGRELWVGALVALMFTAEVITKITMTSLYGVAVELPPGFVGCILSTTPAGSRVYVWVWVTEAFTDALVLSLTLWRSYSLFYKQRVAPMYLWRILVQDGILYFLLMLSVNLVTVIQYLVLPVDLKAVNANMGAVLASLLVSRIVLNLRMADEQSASGGVTQYRHTGFTGYQTALEATVCGELGNQMESDATPVATYVSDESYKMKYLELPK